MSIERSLKNKRALVTGAARRIGAAIARRLHSDGARVGIHYRRSSAAAEVLCDELNAIRPDSARMFRADLARTASLQDLVDEFVGWCGGLEILVNNASSFYPTPIGTVTESQWDDLLASNLKAPLFLSQSALPYLRREHGSIINIADIHARRPLRDHAVYGSAKAGLEMLTRALAKDLAPEIRVNAIEPGAILWPEKGMTDEIKQQILRQIPLARPGAPEDIADCVLYLVRDAGYVTGQVIAVDGGRSLGW
ncbi:MAG: pteridine reductase [Gammaproteobacteria bacterium]|nr:pteridine reductase [Gammaproteobacteria bacterium]MDH4253232.1 pteridine reductase [Gammaproteobacteria bacterium]MDH5308989.1 pteridine reductase [Gammaproteobacteria bacterium]